jgi:hypothetical protein
MCSLRQIVHEATGGVAVVLAERFRVGPFQGRQSWEKEWVFKAGGIARTVRPAVSRGIACSQTRQRVEQASKVEPADTTVRIGEVRSILMCRGKMLLTGEQTVMSKPCLPCIVGMLVLLPEREGNVCNPLSAKTRGPVGQPTSPM